MKVETDSGPEVARLRTNVKIVSKGSAGIVNKTKVTLDMPASIIFKWASPNDGPKAICKNISRSSKNVKLGIFPSPRAYMEESSEFF